EKPRGDDSDSDWERRLVAAVKMVARIKVITHLRGRLAGPGRVSGPHGRVAGVEAPARRLIAVGASTGGPAALVEILRGLPEKFPIPILIVIHISQPFDAAFAEWLDGLARLSVRYARDGEPVPRLGEAGVVLAPAGRHLVVERGRLRLTDGPERHSC